MTAARAVAPNLGGRANTRSRAAVASCIYGCTKLQASIADAGSTPATSTTTGVHGFDGMWMGNGQLGMVPTAPGSAWSGVRCDGPNSQTPMTAFIGLRRQPDVPAARNGTQGRHPSFAAALHSRDGSFARSRGSFFLARHELRAR